MKNLFKVVGVLLISALAFSACEKKPAYDYAAAVEQLTAKKTEMTNLLSSAVFGTGDGQYPESSKSILENAISAISSVIEEFNAENGSEATLNAAIASADQAIENFKSTVITIKKGYVWCESEGSYIDFGNHPEFITFGQSTQGEFQFSVDFWWYTDIEWDNWAQMIGTATNGGEQGGWNVSYFDGGKMRVVHIAGNEGGGYSWRETDMKVNGEVDLRPTFNKKWVHVVLVFRDKNVEGDKISGFVNGEKAAAMGLDDNHTGYAFDNKDFSHMLAFARTPNGTEEIKEGFCTGSIRDLHLWSKALSDDEIKDLYDGITVVTKDTPGLVAGWSFTEFTEEREAILDITGNFTCKLVGEDISFKEGVLY